MTIFIAISLKTCKIILFTIFQTVLKRKLELWQIWQVRQQGRKIRLRSLELIIIPKLHIVSKKDVNVFMS